MKTISVDDIRVMVDFCEAMMNEVEEDQQANEAVLYFRERIARVREAVTFAMEEGEEE
ncbi:MAG: hypothetical protein LC687_02205 [Actinobacteria bacterium]|nr:hypothetical protein [Actinomycetota bacterium]